MTAKELAALRKDLIGATRLAFDLCRQAVAGQTVYAYALIEASPFGEALQPVCHTEETNARQEGKRPSKTPAEAGFRRYCPDEWWATAVGSVPMPGGGGKDWWDDIRPRYHAACVQAGTDDLNWGFTLLTDTLAALDADGYFGTGAAREAVTLMVFVSDHPVSEEWMRESVRRLNPPKVVTRFRTATAPPKKK